MESTLETYKAECEAYIRDTDAQRAFQLLVGSFGASAGFEARPYPHGYVKRDVSIYCQGERLYSVCATQRWVLVYLRKVGLQRKPVEFAALRASFPSVEPNQRGDISIRITDPAAAARLLEIIGIAQPAGISRIRFAEEIRDADRYLEGAVKPITVNAYERNPLARSKCIAHHGCRCVVCGFSFENRYGEIGSGFIHVHHLTPLAAQKGRVYELDPVRDLRPVCPNCHAMLHQTEPPLTIDELQQQMRP